jgi:hypothetical protein
MKERNMPPIYNEAIVDEDLRIISHKTWNGVNIRICYVYNGWQSKEDAIRLFWKEYDRLDANRRLEQRKY